MSLVKYYLTKDAITSGNDLCHGCLGNYLSELVPMMSIFTPTNILWHDGYILIHTVAVLYQLKYYLAQDPLKAFIILIIYYLYHAKDIFYSLQQVEC